MVKKRILITGIISLLGRYLVRVLKKDYTLFGTIHNHRSNLLSQDHLFPLDVTDSNAVKLLISKIRPSVVIHLAALSNIDYCELHPKESYYVNVTGTKNVIKALEKTFAHLIFSSSNAVFSGAKPPYTENDIAFPLNIYGRTKEEASRMLRRSKITSTIIRFTSMFGWPPSGARDNDVTFYLKKLKEEFKLYLVNDRFFNPLYVLRGAQAITQIIKEKKAGIFHIAGKDTITRYTFVKETKQVFAPHAQAQLVPVTNTFFPDLAPRPPDATLSTTKMEKILHMKPKFLHEELLRMKAEKEV